MGIKLFFGDKNNAFPAQGLWHINDARELLNTPCLQGIDFKPVEELVLLRQTHSADGYRALPAMQSFVHEGDYLVTDRKEVALGVATADCLPIILHDIMHQAIAVIHAGWRGSLAQIALRALEHMHRDFGSMPQDTRVYFGPYGAGCCYQVQQNFSGPVTVRDGKFYFDSLAYNKNLLSTAGIPETNFDITHAQCTICNPEFCSFRREQEQALRQLTFAALV